MWLILILAVSFLFKSPFTVQPFLGYFGSYQSLVGMIAKEYVRHDFSNFLYPASMMLTDGKPSLEMIYHPFSSFLAGLFWRFFGGSLDYWGRFQAILFSFMATIFIYLVAKMIRDRRYALMVAAIFSFSPMTLIFGRTFMNESMALALSILSFLLLQMGEKRRNLFYYVLSGIVFSAVLVLRIHFICALPAYFLYILLSQNEQKVLSAVIFLIGTISVALAWFWHTYCVTMEYPNVHTSIFIQIDARSIPDPLLATREFYERVFLKDLLFRLLGPFSFLIAFVGFLQLWKGSLFREKVWIPIFIASIFGLIFIWPSKFYAHPFYLIPLIFPGSLLAGLGMELIFKKTDNLKLVSSMLIVSILVDVILFWRPAFAEPLDKNSFFEAVKFVSENTKPTDRILAIHGTSTDFLYYTDRYGVGYNLGIDRSELPMYFKSKKFLKISGTEFNARNEAYRNPVTWFEYLKEKNGLHYFAITPKSDLGIEPELEAYLKRKYELVSPEEAEFAVYRLV